jgi:hypothetical protein
VTNTWEQGRLDLTKVITGVGADMEAEFLVCVQRLTPTIGSEICDVELGHGDTESLALPPGTYRVYEPGLTTGWTAVVTPGTTTVVAGQIASATITNTWNQTPPPPPPPPPPTTGSVELTKEVLGTPAAGEDIDGTFELCLTGPSPATTEICRTVETIDGTGTVLITGLTPGTYTVAETDPGDGYLVDVGDETVTVVAGQTDTSTITNTIVQDEEGEIIPPPVTPPEEEESDSGGPVPTPVTPLPHTGIELTLALVATATLGAGVLMLTVARRRTVR